jgi:hypothetical protein
LTPPRADAKVAQDVGFYYLEAHYGEQPMIATLERYLQPCRIIPRHAS